LRVTVEKVAQRAGVSRALASSVLSGGIPAIRYSEETRQRVQMAAKALNYTRRAVNGIGLIHSLGPIKPEETNWVQWLGRMLESIHTESVANNKMVSVFSLSSAEISSMFKGSHGPEILKRRKVDGLIISGVFDEMLIDQVKRAGLPFVLMNVDNSHIHEMDSVFFDDLFAGRQATEYMIKKGHRRILHVTPRHRHQHYSVMHRRRGYEQAMKDARLQPMVVSERIDTPPAGYQLNESFVASLREALGGDDRPTAIFCYNEVATLCCHRVMEQMRLTREDVNLITVGTSYSLLMEFWGIPQVEMPVVEVGKHAYRMLMEKQETGKAVPSVAVRGHIRDC